MSRTAPEPEPDATSDPNPNQTQVQQTDLYTELPNTQPWVLDDGEPDAEPGLAPAQPQIQPSVQPQPGPQPYQAPAQPPAQPPGGQYSHVHTLPTGHTFYGNSEAEILSQVSQFAAQQLHPTQAAAQVDYTRRSMTPPGTYQYQAPAAPQPPAFDKESFYRNLVADPVSAIHQALQNYLGVDDPREVINYSYETSRTINREQEVGKFHQMNPDFPASPVAGNMVMDRLESEAAEPTAWNLTVAYQQLVREGRLAPVQARPNGGNGQAQAPAQYQAPAQPQYQSPAQPRQVQPQRGRRAPITPGTAPSALDTPLNQMTPLKFENMSADDQRVWLNKNNIPM